MSAPLKVAGRLAYALALATLVALAPGELWPQQVQLGRQKDLGPDKIEEIRTQIRELDGRAIIGFKPVQATQGMRPNGTPALSGSAVGSLVARLGPLGVNVDRQFRIIPAVAVRMDPDRLEELLADPNVDYVEPDYLKELVGRVPDVAAQSTQETPWGIERIAAPAAWGITRGAGVKLGIIDTGIDEDHPDLNPVGGVNIVTGGTGRSDWNDGSSICPTHGTHVSGTAAALDNTIQVVGVAPLAQLYAIRVFDPENAGLPICVAFNSHTIGGIEWAAGNGMDVINLSLSSGSPSLAEADAVSAAHAANIVVVAAAGNDDGSSVDFPAAYPKAIAVTATNVFDDIASFSNRGPEVEFAAPGVSVTSTVGNGGIGTASGTSMATPHVAGTVALLRAARPDLSVEEMRQVLRSTAVDVSAAGFDVASGWGLIDAGAAVNAVATTNLALAMIPGDIYVSIDPDAAPVTNAVEIRNVGASGTIDWTASDDQAWLSIDPTSGSASDATPGQLDVTVDPAGLAIGTHTGFVTISGNAANSPTQIRVRLAVAESVPVDASVTTQGVLPLGERLRYVLSGTAGQAIDVALLRDLDHPLPLEDPYLRIFMPDGETLLAFNDDAGDAGLERQSLLYSVVLPEDGNYVIEVGAWEDGSAGGFLLKARAAGPILGVDPVVAVGRAEWNGDPGTAEIDVFNLSGVGSTGWTATSPQPWLSADPGTGTAVPPAGAVAVGRSLETMPEYSRRTFPQREHRAWGEPSTPAKVPGATPSEAKLRDPGLRALARPVGTKVGPPLKDARTQSTAVTLWIDPTDLDLGYNEGVVDFTPDDGWLTASATVLAWVYSPGMTVISGLLLGPWGATTDAQTDRAIVSTGEDSGSLIPAGESGLDAAVATGFDPFPSDVTLGTEGDWYVGSGDPEGNPLIRKIGRYGGVSTFAQLPGSAFWLATGPQGEIFATSCLLDSTFRVSPDGTTVGAIGPSLSCPLGVDYRPQDNSIYIANFGDFLQRVDLGDGSTSQVGQDLIAWDVAVGRSGKIYVSGVDGVIWLVDPDASTELFALAPSPSDLLGIALVEGGLILVANDDDLGEVYFFPVDDGPRIGGEGDLFARLGVEEVDGLLGEPFEVPLLLDMASSTREATDFAVSLEWTPGLLEFIGIAEGDFGGSFTADVDQAAAGIIEATASRTTGLSGGVRTLFSVTFSMDASVNPGDQVDVTVVFDQLSGPFSQDLLAVLTVESGSLCVSPWLWGDVDRDGTVGSGDATQILRHLVDLPLADGADIELGDVNRDGVVNGVDAVQILRHLVELPIPAESHVDGYGVGACQ